ncbi:sigma-70 family RNA polymerase sigma factor [Actinophytocola oryzae]|uniref:RNA polymerase RpoE-like sigma-24 subunit n=1 Tax=Actinophytocola oryzae TaxID=502181 RepID=A0A4R7VVH0_9PSEU|nr:sigma-70 family RNA polymerase sigma factor [Actinophytocola oryzae]TDV53615.1 RNA polymerase RpoE-like sigma-24 subunit [Actinophytocola oryzae]
MSDSGDEVTDLAVAAGRGDRDAASALIRATQRDVWRFLLYLVGHGDAEDLTRETFVRALRGARRFGARDTGRTWLLAIARGVAADHLRTAASRPHIAADQERYRAAEEVAARQLPGPDDTVAINDAVRNLPPDRRDAFVLTQVLGLGYPDAARVCDCPVGTIRSRVARARQDLVTALAASLRPASRQAQRR